MGRRRIVVGVTAAALLTIALFAAAAGAKTKTTTYSSGVVNIPIPDASPITGPSHITSTIPVGDKGTIKKVTVGIRVTHTFDGDLVIRSLKGDTWVTLADGVGGANFGQGTPECAGQGTSVLTIFDDSAPIPIFDGGEPFAGTFRPDVNGYGHSLSQYKDQKSNGTWTLSVSDLAPLDVGSLHCWQVTIKRKVAK